MAEFFDYEKKMVWCSKNYTRHVDCILVGLEHVYMVMVLQGVLYDSIIYS